MSAAGGDQPVVESAPVVLERRNLKDQIATAIRTEIFTGRMKPDRTYKMGELAAKYGASRTPMRDAVLELESKGLVRVTQGVGFTVIAPTAQDLRDILALREMLEVPAMSDLAGRLSPEATRHARELLEQLGKASAANDLAAYVETDRTFHAFLLSQTGNRKLGEVVSDLRDACRAPGLVRLADQGKLAERHHDHQEMLDAIESGDRDLVAEVVQRHMDLTWTGIDADDAGDLAQ